MKKIILLLVILSIPIIGVNAVQYHFEHQDESISANCIGVKVRWEEDFESDHSNPLIADLDSDGKAEIVIGDNEGYIYCFNHKGRTKWLYDTEDIKIESTATVAYIDQDGKFEVIFGAGLFFPHIYCFEDSGYLKWKYPYRAMHLAIAPAIGDVDFNGELDIIMTGNSGNVTCMTGTTESK
ncbi:MAG: hypothetical protein ACTSO7_06380 [Candidatus Heimdallarchaeota archaeon]